MRFEGRVAIQSPRDRVWAFLTNPAHIAGCAPGLEGWREVIPAREFVLVGAVAVGGSASKMRLPATVRWHHLDAPRRLEATAVVPVAGSQLDLKGNFDLVPHPDASTHLNFVLDAALPPGIAPPFRQLVANVLPGVVERFFRCLKTQLEAAEAA